MVMAQKSRHRTEAAVGARNVLRDLSKPSFLCVALVAGLSSSDLGAQFQPDGDAQEWSLDSAVDAEISLRQADLARSREAILAVTREVAESEAFRDVVLGEPRVLGVDGLEPSGVIIRFVIRTLAHEKNSVKREILERIVERFRELGIEMPYERRSLYHHLRKPEEDEGYQPPSR